MAHAPSTRGGWADQITAARARRGTAAIADTAYVKHTRLAPRPKKSKAPRTEDYRRSNRRIANMRAPVERTIALLKQWKILAIGYRGRLTELPSIIHVITNLEFYKLTD